MKNKLFKRILACGLALAMTFGMSDAVSAATITKQIQTNTSSSTGKVRITIDGETDDDAVTIISRNLKTGNSSEKTTSYITVDLNLAASTWYKTTLKGIDQYGSYNSNKHTYYLAKSPKLKAKYASGTRIKVSWNKVYGSSYYKVFMKKASGSWKKVKTTKSTSYTTSKLSTYTNYTFYVRAYKKVNGKTYASAKPNYKPTWYIYTYTK